MIATCDQASLLGSGAAPGQDLWVSGKSGCSALGLAWLLGERELPAELAKTCVEQHLSPRARIGLGQRLHKDSLARSLIDVSDGIFQDSVHLAIQSEVTIEIEIPLLPIPSGLSPDLQERATRGGEDYELLFSASADARTSLGALAMELDIPLTRIGKILPAQAHAPLIVRDANGYETALSISDCLSTGYQHFRNPL